MTPRNEPDFAHPGLDVFEEHTDGEQVVVGVRPELDVLMPFHLFPAARRLEVQLRVVELHVRPDEVAHHVDDHRRRRERPVRLVQIRRRAQPPQSRLLGGVPRVEVEQHVRLGERAALLDELRGHCAQPLQRRGVDEPGHGQPALLPVLGALPVGEHHAYAVTGADRLDFGPVPRLFVAFTTHV